MNSKSTKKLRKRLLIFCHHIIFIFVLVVPTAVAQSTQTGLISGRVHNGTTNEPAPEGSLVTLHAYNGSFTSTETVTATLDANGRFQFALTDKPADWVYMVSADHQGLSFSSTIASLTGEQPLDLSLTIYDTSNDPANVVLDRLEITLTSIDESVQVIELYAFANVGTAVFVGSTETAGVQIQLPDGAQTPTFEQGMGPNSGFFPANDMFEQNGRWSFNFPLRPGPNSLTLRVSYLLPANAMALSRSLPYQTNSVLLAVPDAFAFADEAWQQQATQSIGERGVLRQFSISNLAAGSSLQLSVDRASKTTETNEKFYIESGNWLLSLIILSFMATLAFRLLRPDPLETAVPRFATSAGSIPTTKDEKSKEERWNLLFELADLDAAFKNGKLTKEDYQRQRQAVKNRLRDIWEVV